MHRLSGFGLSVCRDLSWSDWGIIALAFTLHAAFFPWFPKLRSPNELTRVYLASALVEDGTVRVDRQVREHGRILDLSTRKVDGVAHYYSDKAPGVALLSAPLFALYDAVAPETTLEGKVRLMRLWVSTLPTAVLLVLLFGFLRAYIDDGPLTRMLVTSYAFGTPAAAYAGLAFGHQLSAVTLFTLFLGIRGTSTDAPRWRSMLIGAAASLAVLVEYQNALLLLPFVALFLWRTGFRPSHVACALLGAVPLISVLLVYHQAAFGSPFATGYSHLASSFKHVHAQGLLGVSFPKASHAFLSFLSPSKGLFFFAPWLALAIPGALLLWRSRRPELRFTTVYLVLYSLFVSSLVYVAGGWTVSQRHLVPIIPFLVLPVGLLLGSLGRWGRLGRAVFAGLALPSIFACSVSYVVWPHYQEHLANPFWQVGWPLFLDGWVAPSVFSIVGISSWAAAAAILGVVFLFLLAQLFAPRPTGGVRSLAVAVATAVLWGYFARIPGSAQNIERDRAFIERAYASQVQPR